MRALFPAPAKGHVPHETEVLSTEEIHKDPLKPLGVNETFSHFKCFFLCNVTCAKTYRTHTHNLLGKLFQREAPHTPYPS